MPRLKAMNSGELDREDFGFSVAEGSLARPPCAGGANSPANCEWVTK